MKTNNTLKTISAAMLLACGVVLNANAQDGNVYAYHAGHVVFMDSENNINRVALESNKTVISFYDNDEKVLFTTPANGIDSISFNFTAPVADMLDVQFGEDGSVNDVSPMHNPIQTFATEDGEHYAESVVPVRYSDQYGRYIATYANDWGKGSLGKNGVYSKMDYSSNSDFMAKLADGHTLRAIFCANDEVPDAESKWFSGHEAGGTGLMVCKSGKGMNGGNDITFLPNVSADGSKSNWIWAVSGVRPEPGTFYDVVGVWNKEEGKAYIYVNGELLNTVEAAGELHFPNNEAARWLAIGCDAGPKGGQFGGNWDIVTTKVYDAPLSKYDVQMMYNEAQY